MKLVQIAEPKPILCKDSARRAQWNLFRLPSRSLSYAKIRQKRETTKEMSRFVGRKNLAWKIFFLGEIFYFSACFLSKTRRVFFEIYTGKHDSALVTLQTKTKKQEGYLHNSLQKKAGQPSHDATAQLMFTTNYCFLLALSFSAQALQSSYLYSFFYLNRQSLSIPIIYLS